MSNKAKDKPAPDPSKALEEMLQEMAEKSYGTIWHELARACFQHEYHELTDENQEVIQHATHLATEACMSHICSEILDNLTPGNKLMPGVFTR